MCCFHQFGRSDNTKLVIIISALVIGILANIVWCWVTLSKYLDYARLNIKIQIRLSTGDATANVMSLQILLDLITMPLFNLYFYRLTRKMTGKYPKIFSVCKNLICSAFHCQQNKSVQSRAYELNHNFKDANASRDKCAICWGQLSHQQSQYLLQCGHRFHAHCLETAQPCITGAQPADSSTINRRAGHSNTPSIYYTHDVRVGLETRTAQAVSCLTLVMYQ